MKTSANLRAPALGSLPIAAAFFLSGCGGSDNGPITSVQVAQAAAKCAGLVAAVVPASAIGLPTRGAVLTSAELQSADAAAGSPEFCKVLGSIQATNAGDPSIDFQVNLPTSWNVKALQYGGGGLNGSVVTGLTQYTHGPVQGPHPLAMGYVTFGSDSGHQGSQLDGSFGLNVQALANYAGESVKRTHDTAKYLMQRYYDVAPRRMYHIGGSKGGHEGLVAAQRYGSDYDGVVAYYPASQNPLLVLSWYRMWRASYATEGGEMNTAKQALLKERVLAACDALDGATDGIVSHAKSCEMVFDVNSLRCPSGTDEGDTCLSDAQIATLRTANTVMDFAFPMANGYTQIGPYPVFLGADLGGNLFDNPLFPIPLGRGKVNSYYFLADPVIRMWYQQDSNSSFTDFDYRQYQPRIQQFSAMYDSSNPSMDTFRNKGGKLIIIQGSTDMLVPQAATTAYWTSVQKRYGTNDTSGFAKYYVQPGFGHAAGDFQMSWDALTALDSWVDASKAPSNPVSVDANPATLGRARPLCEYPLFPKYNGSGDLNQAASYTCSAS